MLQLLMKTDILLSVRTPQQSHQLWMKPGSAIFEFFEPGHYTRESRASLSAISRSLAISTQRLIIRHYLTPQTTPRWSVLPPSRVLFSPRNPSLTVLPPTRSPPPALRRIRTPPPRRTQGQALRLARQRGLSVPLCSSFSLLFSSSRRRVADFPLTARSTDKQSTGGNVIPLSTDFVVEQVRAYLETQEKGAPILG